MPPCQIEANCHIAVLRKALMPAPSSTSQNLSNFVWGIADQLRGVYTLNQYGMVVLPPTIPRRVEELMPPLGDHAGAG